MSGKPQRRFKDGQGQGGQGRGRGDAGRGRGDAGRGRGDAGRGRGDAGRGRGDAGRGRGDAGRGRGDAGRGRGDAGRGRGDARRGRGGGDRGARGGGRGGAVRQGGGGARCSSGAQVYSDPTSGIPAPDPNVTKIEDALQTAAQEYRNLDKLKSKAGFPQRPGYGTRGDQVVLWANYVTLVPKTDLVLRNYEVSVTPEVFGRKLVQVIRLLLERTEFDAFRDDIVTDFKKTLISRQKLPKDDVTYTIKYRRESEDEPFRDAANYKIRIIFNRTLNVSELINYLTSTNLSAFFDDTQDLVQAFNIFLNHYAKSAGNLATIGASKTFKLGPNADTWDLGSGLTAIRGFFSSMRVVAARILINVQISHGAFFDEGPVTGLMRKYLNTHRQDKRALQRFLNKVRVRTTHLDMKRNKAGEDVLRAKSIFGLATINDGKELQNPPRVRGNYAGAKDVEFWLDGEASSSSQSGQARGKAGKGKGTAKAPPASGRYISVFDFFRTTHKITLKYPDLPVINTRDKRNPTYLPAEVCMVLPGQNCKSKLDPSQTQKMIEFAVRKPWQNATSIVNQGLQCVGLDAGTNPLLKRFGLNTPPNLITVHGRVLSAPKICYKGTKTISPDCGRWNMKGEVQFNASVTNKKWSYVMISMPGSKNAFSGPQPLAEMITSFHSVLKAMGLTIPVPEETTGCIHLKNVDDPKLGDYIKAAATSINLLFIILPEVNTLLYNRIKRYADVRHGLHTVCSVGHKFAKGQDQYFANLALKFNLKLGGVNHLVEKGCLSLIHQNKTMIVGIDVTHPSPGSTSNAPSIAAMVASIDSNLGQWPATLSVQTARQEQVADLTTMLKSRLKLWKGTHSNKYPENILVYRDGVSEGQYQTVIDSELPLLRKACKELYPVPDTKKGLPRFTIVIAGKRHKTRFYPTTTSSCTPTSNPLPGTIVDRGITTPRSWDFFLQAHAALHGTARPCHYFVLLDEIFRQGGTKVMPGMTYRGAANTLEDLTLALCYVFGRATCAVSLCTPTFYADLACERARGWLGDVFEREEGGSEEAGGPQVKDGDVLVHEKLRDSMFYL